MSPTILYAFVNIVIALMIFGLSVPLIFRKIPMNHFYGIRFPQSFTSDEAWYKINEYGGKALLIASIPILLVGLYGLFQNPDHYLFISSSVLILSLFVACLVSYFKARQI